MGLCVISAGKGEGKTTFLRSYVAQASDSGRRIGGIAAPAVFEADKRVGYDLVNLQDGQTRRLARVISPGDAQPTVGVYQLDENAVAEGKEAIVSAVREGLDVIAIDEIGPLECRGGGWAAAFVVALRDIRPDQELVITVRPSLVEELPDRFPSPLWNEARHIPPPWPQFS